MGFSLFTDLITPSKYDLPEAPTVDITGEQLANVQANAATFRDAKGLAEEFNKFMQEQVSMQLRQTVPEFEGLEAQTAQNLGAQLRGELTQSDLAASQRKSAAGALGLGTYGSPAGAAYSAFNVGKLQYEIQRNAQQQTPQFLSTMATAKRAPLFNFDKAFMTPAQRIGFQFENQMRRFNVQNLKNQMDAQPAPWLKAVAGAGDAILDAVAAYYTGGMSAKTGSGAGSRGDKIGFRVGDAMQQSNMMNDYYGRPYGNGGGGGFNGGGYNDAINNSSNWMDGGGSTALSSSFYG